MRHVRLEISNGLIKSLSRLGRSRRKEFERERRRIPPHDIGDVHQFGFYLRACWDFWSTDDERLTRCHFATAKLRKLALEIPNHLSVSENLRLRSLRTRATGPGWSVALFDNDSCSECRSRARNRLSPSRFQDRCRSSHDLTR